MSSWCVLQDEMRRLEGVEHAEQELNMLQQAHAIAAAQQEMARLAAADHRAAIAQHEHKLQQMHEAQVLLTQRGRGGVGGRGLPSSLPWLVFFVTSYGCWRCFLLPLSPIVVVSSLPFLALFPPPPPTCLDGCQLGAPAGSR